MPLRFLLKALTGTALLLGLLYSGISWSLASAVTKAERHPVERTPGSVGLAYEPVEFPSRDGSVLLRGWTIPVQGALGVVIVVHGLDSHRASEGAGTLELTRRLADEGFALLLFDLRGHGESGDGRLSGGYFEQADVLGAFDYLVERGVPRGRIGVLGFSMGAAVGLLAAAQEPRLRAVVADSAFADIKDLIVSEVRQRTTMPDGLVPALIPGMELAGQLVYGIVLREVAPVRAVARLEYPLLLIHGEDDTRIPADHAQRLLAAARHPSTQLWLVPDVGHARAFKSAPEEYTRRVADYFRARFSE